jgi:UPF0755 protein
MSKKVIIIVLVVIFGIGAVLVGPKALLFLAGRQTTINEKSMDFYFNANIGLEGLATKLYNEKFIDDKEALIKVGEYKKLNSNKLASGKYSITSGTNFRALLNGFTKNSAGNGNAEVEVEVTFNNCRDVYQLAGKVSKLIMVDSSSLVQEITSPKLLAEMHVTLETLPSIFLPNTYRMFYDTDASQFVNLMAKQYTLFWNDERLNKLKKVGLKTPFEASTLASIVYSEQSKNKEEWPIIAGLYLNRVAQGMKLQSDPTFKFCWGDDLKGVQRLTYEHREIDCPYNTYKNNGLPPGPICIPPFEVIDAVINPDDNNFLYMCATPDYTGKHNFEHEYSQHKKNADIFQSWISKQ